MSKSSGKRVSAFAKVNGGKGKNGLDAIDADTSKTKAKKKRSNNVSPKTKGKIRQSKKKSQNVCNSVKLENTENDKKDAVKIDKKKTRKKKKRMYYNDDSSKETGLEEIVIDHKIDKKQKANKRKQSKSSDRTSKTDEFRKQKSNKRKHIELSSETDGFDKIFLQEDLIQFPSKKRGKRSNQNEQQHNDLKSGRFESVAANSDDFDRSDLSINISDESDTDLITEPKSTEEIQTDDVIITRCSNFNKASSESQHIFSPYSIPAIDGVLVILPHPSEYIFKGKATVSMIVGTASIQGYHLQPDKPVDIFSPDCTSLLTVKTIQSESRIKKTVSKCKNICKRTNHKQIIEIDSVLKRFRSFVVLMIEKNVSNTLDHVTNFDSFSRLFTVEVDETDVNKQLVPIGASLLEESRTPCIEINTDLENILEMWSGKGVKDLPTSILVCGGKDCGKSTTNRLLLNSTLSNHHSSESKEDDLYYLELDVGQSEFTPPGCVSLVKVTEPLLGPPFTHQKEPVYACAYGGVTPSDDPDRYTACVQACVARYRQMGSPGRLVVNTMGWMKGLGYQLLVDAVNLIKPQYIVQLSSARRNTNIEPLEQDFYHHTSWLDLSMDRNIQPVYRCPDYNPIIIHHQNPVAPLFMSKYQASDHRNLSILSHLCHDLDPALTLTSIAPFTVRFEDVAVHVCGADVPQSQVLYAFNGSLVALCKADMSKAKQTVSDGPLFFTSLPVFEWLGYGIVRGIDPVKKLFYLVTTLSKDKLDMVNTFLKGSVLIPGQLILSQKCSEIAYVDTYTKSVGSSSVKPRHHMPRKSLRPKDGGPASSKTSI